MYLAYKNYLNYLHNNGKYRDLGKIINLKTRDINFLDFSTNDYLNLSYHNDLIMAAKVASHKYGIGATGSRLLSGNLELYEQFEQIIALDKNSESSLIFNSGFQANLSTLACLLDSQILHAKPLVFFDKLNHASLYQAVFLSKAELFRYRHNDMDHLGSLLLKHKNDPRPKFIVTETVFGMDGDFAPLEQILEFAINYDAFLYLDEAHATGVFGINGYGLSTTLKLRNIPHIVMGTFSKAIGVSGGYIACHNIIRDFLVNKATGFIYSTAPSPCAMGAALKAWQLVKTLNKEREMLQKLGNSLRIMLTNQGFNVGTSQTHIIPIILKEEKKCLAAQQCLYKKGIIVSYIRSPTVPPGTARLRIALTAKHTLQDLEKLTTVLSKLEQR